MIQLNNLITTIIFSIVSISVSLGILLNKLQNSRKIGVKLEMQVSLLLFLTGFIVNNIYGAISIFVIIAALIIYTLGYMEPVYKAVNGLFFKSIIFFICLIPAILLVLIYNNINKDLFLIVSYIVIGILVVSVLIVTIINKSNYHHLVYSLPIVLFLFSGAIIFDSAILKTSPYILILLVSFLYITLSYIREVTLEIIYKKNNFDALNKYQLTSREKQIALLLVNGKKYKEISESLNISLKTVNSHVNNLYKKCNINNRSALMRILY